MERFVQLVVAGGVLLVAALWGAAGAAPQSLAWMAATAFAAIGCATVLAGIWLELDLDN